MKTLQTQRIAMQALMALLMAGYVSMAIWSSVHLDMARDMRVALNIRDGLDFPLVGPIMASHVRLGPVWYYFLALLGSLSAGWFGTVFLLALVSAVQFPLAYLAGKEWKDKTTGLLWAVLLLLPSWSTFEQFNPTHTQLTALLVLAFLLCALRFYHRSAMKYFIAASFVFSLAIHAHPSAFAMAPIALALVVLAARRKKLTVKAFSLAAAVFVVPFVPWIWNEAANGFASYGAWSNYTASENTRNISLGNVPLLAWQMVWGGLQYWTQHIVQLQAWQVFSINLLWACIAMVGLAAALYSALRKDRVTACFLAILVFSLCFIAVVRGYFPYYMTTVAKVLLCGIIARGFSFFSEVKNYRTAFFAFVFIFSVSSYAMVLEKTAKLQNNGDWPLSFLPLFHVTHTTSEHKPLAIMPAHAMQSSGDFLCGDQSQGVHGAYAVHLVHGYALEARFACNKKNVQVGGGNNGGGVHWMGASRAMLETVQRKPEFTMGPFGFLPVKRWVHSADLRVVSTANFLPVKPGKNFKTSHYSIPRISDGEILAITDLGFSFVPDMDIKVRSNDALIRTIARDRTTHFYQCNDCSLLEIEIISTNPENIEIVTF